MRRTTYVHEPFRKSPLIKSAAEQKGGLDTSKVASFQYAPHLLAANNYKKMSRKYAEKGLQRSRT